MTSDFLKREIVALFENQIRLTPLEIKKALRSQTQRFSNSQIAASIRDLVRDGSLVYTNHFSITHLEVNYKRPDYQQSKAISITDEPEACEGDGSRIIISDGAAFGMGDHPTTRLAVEGLDWVISRLKREGGYRNAAVLDIGTGSGVLAIAAVRLGANRALGIDIDAQALHEARVNVLRNGMEDRITISEADLKQLGSGDYALVLANLRPPTLLKLFPEMRRVTALHGYWVLSGFRPDEVPFIERGLEKVSFSVIWSAEAGRWCGLAAKIENRALGAIIGAKQKSM